MYTVALIWLRQIIIDQILNSRIAQMAGFLSYPPPLNVTDYKQQKCYESHWPGLDVMQFWIKENIS
jgi:hypothetical protein